MSLVAGNNQDPVRSYEKAKSQEDDDQSPFMQHAFHAAKRTTITATPSPSLEGAQRGRGGGGEGASITSSSNNKNNVKRRKTASAMETTTTSNQDSLHQIQTAEYVKCISCGDSVLKEQKAEHDEKVCPETCVPCDFAFAGCYYACRRRDMPRHHTTALAVHSKLLCGQMKELKTIMESPLLSVTWTIRDLPSLSALESAVCLESSEFTVLVPGVGHLSLHLTAKISSSNNKLSVFLRQSQGNDICAVDITGTTVTVHAAYPRDAVRVFPPNSILDEDGLGFELAEDVSHFTTSEGIKIICRLFARGSSSSLVLETQTIRSDG